MSGSESGSGSGSGSCSGSGSDAANERQQRFVQRFLGAVPHLGALGIAYRGHGADWAELVMPFAEQQLADPDYGIIASGAIFTLIDRKSTRLNSSHVSQSRMPSSA